jgi:hypothetical protein
MERANFVEAVNYAPRLGSSVVKRLAAAADRAFRAPCCSFFTSVGGIEIVARYSAIATPSKKGCTPRFMLRPSTRRASSPTAVLTVQSMRDE